MNIAIFFTKRIRTYQAKKFIEDKSDKNLLDIGYGDKYFMNTFVYINIEGIDKIYQLRNPELNQDVEKGIDYPDNYFDYVTMLAVIEHLNNYDKVLNEIYRVLKKEGLLIITTPKKKSRWITYIYDKEDTKNHKKYFTKKDFENIKGFNLIHYSTFEFKMNQLIVLKKTNNKNIIKDPPLRF